MKTTEKNSENQVNFYKRNLNGMNSKQILITRNGNFDTIYNESLGSHITIGFCPVEFEEGAEVPRGFFKKYGFQRFNPSYNWLNSYYSWLEMLAENGQKVSGNFTGKW
jgi:hypothetical protein